MTWRIAGNSLAVVTIAAAMAIGYVAGADDASADVTQKLQRLLQQRRDTLQARLKVLQEKTQVGIGELGDELNAAIDVLDAELALAATKAERIEVHQRRVETYRKLEQLMIELQRAPPAPPRPAQPTVTIDQTEKMLLATAARLQAEIDLVRVQMGSD